MDVLERLSAQDLMTLWPDELGWPEDIGAIAFLDGTALFDDHGRFKIEDVRRHIESRLHLVPRFRQVLHRPRLGFGWPLWVDASSFDVREHIQALPLADGSDAEILSTCEELRRQPLERSRPLWEMWFLLAPRRDRVAVLFKVHHAIADGMAGVAALGAFLDWERDVTDPPVTAWSPKPLPSARMMLKDNLNRRVQASIAAISSLMHPLTTVRRLRAVWPAVRESFGEGRAPRMSVNARVGRHRRFALIRSSLGETKRVAHSHDAKVNDVLLTAVAGGLRELLQARGEPANVLARAFTPVSLHQASGPAEGNVDGAMVVPLAVGADNAFARLRLIAAETRARKKRARPHAGVIFRNGLIQRAFLRFAPHQRMVNIYVANVPGPSQLLYFAGAPVLEVFPIIPIIGNIALGVGAFSYAGQFNVTVVADRDQIPDVGVFVRGVESSITTLTESVRMRSA